MNFSKENMKYIGRIPSGVRWAITECPGAVIELLDPGHYERVRIYVHCSLATDFDVSRSSGQDELLVKVAETLGHYPPLEKNVIGPVCYEIRHWVTEPVTNPFGELMADR